MKRQLFLAMGSLWLAACSTETPPLVPELPQAPETWELALNETLGEETDSVLFGFVTQIAVDRHDRVWVADREAATIYLFSADGSLIGRWGDRGEGPGEFRDLRAIALGLNDSLYVWDGQLERIQVFIPERGFVRSFHLRWQVEDQPAGITRLGIRPLGATAEALLLQYLPPLIFPDLTAPRPVLVLRATLDGQVQDTLWHMEMPPPLTHRLSGGGIAMVERPFAWQPIFRVDLEGEALWYGRTDTLRLERIDWRRRQRIVVVHYRMDPVPVTEADRDSLKQKEALAMLMRLTGYALPSYKPVFTTFALGPDTTIWVRLSPPAEVTRARWLVFDEQGRLLADTYLPTEVVEIAVGPRIIAARTHDRTRVLLFQRPSATG
ncbi:6-bladed beta-propeller [Rhodothermus marinus]|uniref:6-bladed beta-propeller n=1 Tax=Rhodothermus marinus TaxID=29549 RepID=UPI0037C5F0F8